MQVLGRQHPGRDHVVGGDGDPRGTQRLGDLPAGARRGVGQIRAGDSPMGQLPHGLGGPGIARHDSTSTPSMSNSTAAAIRCATSTRYPSVRPSTSTPARKNPSEHRADVDLDGEVHPGSGSLKIRGATTHCRPPRATRRRPPTTPAPRAHRAPDNPCGPPRWPPRASPPPPSAGTVSGAPSSR